jgi:hypothetical protein
MPGTSQTSLHDRSLGFSSGGSNHPRILDRADPHPALGRSNREYHLRVAGGLANSIGPARPGSDAYVVRPIGYDPQLLASTQWAVDTLLPGVVAVVATGAIFFAVTPAAAFASGLALGGAWGYAGVVYLGSRKDRDQFENASGLFTPAGVPIFAVTQGLGAAYETSSAAARCVAAVEALVRPGSGVPLAGAGALKSGASIVGSAANGGAAALDFKACLKLLGIKGETDPHAALDAGSPTALKL